MNVGLLGELQVEQQLVERGWHPVRLDTGRMAANADLLAINRRRRVAIQVKTTAGSGHSHSDCLAFGYANSYLTKGLPVFNAKESPLTADVVVAVHFQAHASRFVVMPVAYAEALCRLHCDYWAAVPTGIGGTRSMSFPIYLVFVGARRAHCKHHDRVKRCLAAYENAWSILEEPVERLHDPDRWRLLD
jgi:hypothetical protein